MDGYAKSGEEIKRQRNNGMGLRIYFAEERDCDNPSYSEMARGEAAEAAASSLS
ncbi:unnamed protein product [Sphenostylis stenocarpa]|uniref:Uncharacterized protein n=1 Tax=Sphenostylis stenocarpa TaxID=92480 RepID=A0AA86W0F6_9FABA|nr:unnamed protein product [Sphenostylis stenocarpa]